uniref:Uncharacterized protein n=1 Tax=Rhizophora mucronata TaxID=61149 RepID=A0A2P2PQQ2_RHIMU
MLNKAKHNSL